MKVLASAPLLFICVFYWVLPKSPAWLYSRNENDLGRKGVQSLSRKFPKAELTEDFIDEIELSIKLKTGQLNEKTYTQMDLFKERIYKSILSVKIFL